MDSVLFISMHDTSRGPMAVAIFNAMVDPSRASARSAGFRPGAILDPQVLSAMEAVGTPLTPDYSPQLLTYELLRDTTLAIHIGNGAPVRITDNELFWDAPLIRPATREGVELVRRDLEKRIGRLIADRAWRQNLPGASRG
jgi:protein-tyrosine-phosphatase